ncbi:YdeI/OmpD-associated family protein [Isoptericola chiayiensis]|uniref:YdeI/OmpD-associated family protein n=1 Tax=Isoptericola chiayiensis TaxID=579446 RepID=A0ABP8Y244_9MICO|nr:YdeI/OmpD-associated family protein [Isoptericola chiayiensis]NOV99387.1 uncharacterized protein YdeI (YjbR/CyaY-like superfamily) [Isoptericola chiayiensis]
MATPSDDPLLLPDAAAWRSWLDDHEDSAHGGVWLVLARKGRDDAPTTLRRDEALEEALCSGWIDGQARRRDADTTLQRFSPRRPRSTWSLRNREIVGRLVDQGRMRPRGQAEIDRARQDGRWDAAYAGPASIEIPPELAAVLADSPRATAAWDRLTARNRYAILHRLVTLRTDDARVRNAARFVEMLERGETPYPQRRRLHDDGR